MKNTYQKHLGVGLFLLFHRLQWSYQLAFRYKYYMKAEKNKSNAAR